jgi:hypothetical protein
LVPLLSQRLKSIDNLDNSLDLSRKADGDAPVQAYIAGMPGWKRDLGKRLDALIVRNVLASKVSRFRQQMIYLPLPAAEPRLGRRTALTFPLLPPPQKN